MHIFKEADGERRRVTRELDHENFANDASKSTCRGEIEAGILYADEPWNERY